MESTMETRVYKTSDAQRRATAIWKAKNLEYYRKMNRDYVRNRYNSDPDFRESKRAKNLEYYHKVHNQKDAPS